MFRQILRRTLSVVLAIMLVLTTMSAAGVMTASARVNTTTGASTSNVTFIVPEAIYLKPVWNSYYQGTTSNLQIYVNNTLDSSGNLTADYKENTKGVMYFNYANTSSVQISFEWVDSNGSVITSGGNVTFGDSISRSAGTPYTATPSSSAIAITAGTSPTISAEVTGVYLRWIASFTDSQDKLQKTATAYTYVYKPYVQPVGVGIRCENDRGSNHYGSMIAWVSGVHDTASTNGEWYPNANQERYLLPISSGITSSKSVGHDLYAQIPDRFTTDCGNKNPDVWLNQVSSPLYVPDKSIRHLNHNGGAHSSGDDAFYALEYSPTAALTIDTSRYGNLNQIPNLSIGLMVTDDEDSGNSGAWFISDYRGSSTTEYYKKIQQNSTSNPSALWNKYGSASSTVTLLDHKGTPSSPEGGAEGDGLKSVVRWNRTVNSSTSNGLFMAGAGYYNHASGDTIWDVAELRTQITFYNKASLRSAVQNAINKSATLSTNFYNTSSTEWKDYANLYQAASMALGKLDGTFYATATVGGQTKSYTTPDALATALTSAVNTLVSGSGRVTHTATQTYVGLQLQPNGTTYKCVAMSSGSQQSTTTFTTFQKVTFTKDTVDGFTYLGLVATSYAQSVGVGTLLSSLPTWTTASPGATISNGTVTYQHASNTGTDGSGNLYYTYYWLVNNYTVKFDANGGTGSMNDQQFTYNVTQKLSKNQFTRRAFEFNGWATTAAGNVAYEDEQEVSNLAKSGTVTLYAKWTAASYTITYESLGGSLVGTYTTNYTVESAIGLPDAIKPGYKLGGWRANGAGNWGEMSYEAGGSVPAGQYGNVTLRAQWSPITYYVAFNGNGATAGSMSRQTFSYEDEKALTANTFTRTGYTFAGWSLQENATAITFKDKAIVYELTTEDQSTVTMYAVWVPENYTITYNPDGGTIRDTTYTTKYTIAQGVQLPVQLDRTGYAFTGWKPEAAAGNWSTSEVYSGEHAPGMYGTVTLKAQWSLETYTINYILDGGTYASEGYSTSYTFSSSIVLPNAQKAGYLLTGWESDGAGNWGVNEYAAGSVGTGRYGNVTMTAKWTGINYFIAFSGNGSTGGIMQIQNATYGEDVTLNPSAYVRNGYTFLGWSTSNADVTASIADGATVRNLTTIQGETVTLYAVWNKLSYTITYQTNIGKITAYGTETYTETDLIALAIAECRGYTFKGWTPAESVGSWRALATYSGTLDSGNYGNVVLTALWEKNVYAIRYDTAGGTISGTYTTEYSVDTDIFLPTITRAGYTFGGWQADDAWDNIRITTSVPKGLLGDVLLRAVWVQRVYTVRYDANGGTSGTMEEQTMQFDVDETLRINAFERLGYTFSGWALTKDAETARYGNGATVYNLSDEDNGTVTLYAVWGKRSFEIRFNLNGASGSLLKQTAYMDGAAITLRDNKNYLTVTIGSTEYEFMGWAYNKAEADAGTVSYENKAAFSVNTEVLGKAEVNWQLSTPVITLYAVWKDIQVALVPGDGSTTVVNTDEGLIYGLYEGVTETELRESLLKVNGNGRVVINYRTNIGTGTTVTLYNSRDEEVAAYTIIIFGDMDGNGRITTDDTLEIKGSMTGVKEITDPYRRIAGDLNGNGTLDIEDTILMKGIINGIQEYDQTEKKG